MGRYETPGLCLDCQRPLGGATVCLECGLRQVGPDAQRLRETLAEADAIWLGLRQADQPTGAPSPLAPLTATPPAPARRRRTWPALTTPVILLGLGAMCVLVAAIVFVTVSWSDLSLAAKAAILVGVTTIIGLLAAWSIKARLRGSTETMAGLFVLMVVLDIAAADAGGLAGVDAVPDDVMPWVIASLLVAASIGWARPAVRAFGNITVVSLTGTFGAAWLCGLALDDLPVRPEYVALCLAVVLGAGGWLLARMALWTMAVLTGVIGVGLLGLSLAVSLGRVMEASTVSALWAAGDAVGLLLWCGILGGAATLARLPMRWRRVLASAAGLALVLFALRPLEGSDPDLVIGTVAATALLLSLAPAVGPRREPWLAGVRVAAAAPGILAATLLVPAVAEALSRVVDSLHRPWALDPGQVPRGQLGAVTNLPSPLVCGAVVVAVILTAGFVTIGRWTPLPRVVLALAVAACLVVLRYETSLWQIVLALALAVLLTGTAGAVAEDPMAWWGAAGLATVASAASLGSELTTLAMSTALALAFGLLSWRARAARAAVGAAAASLVAAGVALAAGLTLLDVSQGVIGGSLAGLGSAAVLCAELRRHGRPLQQRIGIQGGGLVVAGVGVVVSTVDPRWALPVSLTLLGASLGLVALLRPERPERRLLSIGGGILLASATWVRLAVEDVSVVEAYTLPSAVVLLGVGVWRMRRTPGSRSLTVLGPGLTLALLPSLLAAVGEPTSLRALLLGLAALAVLIAGAVLRWAAALLLGSGVVVVLALLNVAPYAEALPRWVLFATAGAVLLFLGVSWEHRLRDVRALASAMQRLS